MVARKKGINFLTGKGFESTNLGKFLHWALTAGRWIVIITELIVILCFLSRFKLDRDLMDLSETIKQQQAIIASLEDLENNFRNLQKRLQTINQLNKERILTSVFLEELTQVTPFDVSLNELTVKKEEVFISASTLSENSLKNFVLAIEKSPNLEKVNLQEVNKKEVGQIEFSLTASPSAKNKND